MWACVAHEQLWIVALRSLAKHDRGEEHERVHPLSKHAGAEEHENIDE